jgi:hypothetical protein
MPNKPHKFGIKIWLMSDVDSKFVCNGSIYSGKDGEKADDELQGEHVVKKLMEPYFDKGYCVTTDNFSSLKPDNAFLIHKTTTIETIKKQA